MDKNFWHTLGIVLVVCNGLSIIILIETLIFQKPFVSLFIIIFFITLSINKGLFKKKKKESKKPEYEIEGA